MRFPDAFASKFEFRSKRIREVQSKQYLASGLVIIDGIKAIPDQKSWITGTPLIKPLILAIKIKDKYKGIFLNVRNLKFY